MKSNENPKKIWAMIVARASSDEKFKKELLKHPEKVLKDHGVEIPKGHHIHIYENDESTTNLVINHSNNLSLQELNTIQGGFSVGPGRANQE